MCCTIVQIVLGLYDTTCCPLYLFVYIVHSLHDTTVASPRPSKGTRTVPFFILPCGAYYSSTWASAAICTYCTKYLATQLSLFVQRPGKGTRTVPLFLISPAGLFITSTRTRADLLLPFVFWTQGPPVNICKYLPSTTCG